MTKALTTIQPADEQRQIVIGSLANEFAAGNVFDDYRQRKAAQTLRRQRADLELFAECLVAVKFYDPGASKERADLLMTSPTAWANITHGLISMFVQWQLSQDYAVSSVNVRLATVKQYAKLAFKAGTISATEHALIRTVTGFQYKEQVRIDQKRTEVGSRTRREGAKKAESVSLTKAQRRQLKDQPNTPQGRRDALLMCLLLDHGLRCGEIAGLDVTAINLGDNTITFYRPKVNKVQTHTMTKDTHRAAAAYFKQGDAPVMGKLLRGSLKSGKLSNDEMSERAITKRVNILGEKCGIPGLSAHDGRHSWATNAARNGTDPFALQEGGGWNSLTMPRRYVEAARISNEGINLGED